MLAPAMLTSDKRRPPLGKLIEGYGKNDDNAQEDCLNSRVDPQQIHGIGQGQKKDCAKRHHLNPADFAFDADARDHGRRNALQGQLGALMTAWPDPICAVSARPDIDDSIEQITYERMR